MYCGDFRECLDHVPPLHVVDLVTPKVLRENNVEFMKVPCCTDCNDILGSKHLATLSERINFIYNKLVNKLEGETLWSDDEIEELTGNLKRMGKS